MLGINLEISPKSDGRSRQIFWFINEDALANKRQVIELSGSQLSSNNLYLTYYVVTADTSCSLQL